MKPIKLYFKMALPDFVYRFLAKSYFKIHFLTNFPKYYGKGKKCPFCHKEYKKFIASKNRWNLTQNCRENSICPNCQSRERERLILLYLQTETQIFNSKNKVLHIAPEKNLQKYFKKKKNIFYLSGDKSSSLAKDKIDLEKLPFKDNKFDYLICSHVLEHVENDKKALNEIYRVLKKTGQAIILIPIGKNKQTLENIGDGSPEDNTKYFGQFDHKRYYGQDFFDKVEKIGFNLKIFKARKFGTKIVNKNALSTSDEIYLLGK